MGKTVTTEFAWRNPGATRNPRDLNHTPGGSSSGSTAASQTINFHLLSALKPEGPLFVLLLIAEWLALSRPLGVMIGKALRLSSYLDTVGIMGRSVQDVALFDSVLRGNDSTNTPSLDNASIRIGVFIPFRESTEHLMLLALDAGVQTAEKVGATVVDIATSEKFEILSIFIM